MLEVRILSMVAVPRKATRPTGAFALFACDIGPIRMTGCTLALKPTGAVAMYPPRTRSPKAVMMVRDAELREAIVDAASAAYRSAGGVVPVL